MSTTVLLHCLSITREYVCNHATVISKFVNLDDIHCLYPDNKVHVASMGPTWVLSAPAPQVGPMDLVIRVFTHSQTRELQGVYYKYIGGWIDHDTITRDCTISLRGPDTSAQQWGSERDWYFEMDQMIQVILHSQLERTDWMLYYKQTVSDIKVIGLCSQNNNKILREILCIHIYSQTGSQRLKFRKWYQKRTPNLYILNNNSCVKIMGNSEWWFTNIICAGRV